jgi:hypothetical protein
MPVAALFPSTQQWRTNMVDIMYGAGVVVYFDTAGTFCNYWIADWEQYEQAQRSYGNY